MQNDLSSGGDVGLESQEVDASSEASVQLLPSYVECRHGTLKTRSIIFNPLFLRN